MLDVGGRHFATSEATLAKSRYFAGMLGKASIFLDRDPELFEHILPFLRSGSLGALPPFSTAPSMWRALRVEAAFFGLDGLVAALHRTSACSFTATGDRGGVLYWLGTSKRTHTYCNPHKSGAVHVESSRARLGGHVDPTTGNPVHSGVIGPDVSEGGRSRRDALPVIRESDRQQFVEHNPSHSFHFDDADFDEDASLADIFGLTQECFLLYDSSSNRGAEDKTWARVDLRTVTVRPTHYTLCYAGPGYGTGNWNFSGSRDGNT